MRQDARMHLEMKHEIANGVARRLAQSICGTHVVLRVVMRHTLAQIAIVNHAWNLTGKWHRDVLRDNVYKSLEVIMRMRDGTYYLNNTGHRWIEIIDGKRERRTFITASGKEVIRSVNYYEAFGNFATCNISYKGKRINVFADSILED